ncbi:MAG TPA: hypothetical protein VGR05_06505, partial [Sphingomicrobium sp.]|nr:hypothetical protein [Sphingomicrobium sp.]
GLRGGRRGGEQCGGAKRNGSGGYKKTTDHWKNASLVVREVTIVVLRPAPPRSYEQTPTAHQRRAGRGLTSISF